MKSLYRLRLVKLRIKLAWITLNARFSMQPHRSISGERVALLSAMIVLVGLAPITVSGTIKGLESKSLVIPSGVNVEIITPPGVEVGIYWDSSCTMPVSSIDWGTMKPGSSKNVILYIRNEGDAAITLYLEATNWDPVDASNYIDLSWDLSGGKLINPNEVARTTLTLDVSSSIKGISRSNFDILITAS